jgi:transposase
MKIGIDLGKRRSYVVMQDGGTVFKEGYTETSREGFDEFFGQVGEAEIVVEASSSLNRVASLLEGHHLITVANPAKVRVIAESVKKTDKIDAHTLLDLYDKNYLPTSWLPDKRTRELRDICRTRHFLGRQRAAVINRLKYQAYVIGFEFKKLGKKAIGRLKEYPQLGLLLAEYESLCNLIRKSEEQIAMEVAKNHNAELLDTIPGVGKYSALAIATEIGDVARFANEADIFAYAGLVPSIRQSGDREYRGHIVKGNTYLKTLLLQCANTHVQIREDSFVTSAYHRIAYVRGKKIAKIAATRRLLQIIYFMLKRNEKYRTND